MTPVRTAMVAGAVHTDTSVEGVGIAAIAEAAR